MHTEFWSLNLNGETFLKAPTWVSLRYCNRSKIQNYKMLGCEMDSSGLEYGPVADS